MRNYTGHGWEGSNYNGNLDITEISKIVKKKLKEKYPECKFSITIERYSGGQSLNVSLMTAPFQAIICEYKVNHVNGYPEYIKIEGDGYAQLNQYTFHDGYSVNYNRPDGYNNGCSLTKECWNCMEYVASLCSSFRRDDSDGMIDYFDTNFYLHLNIGKWNKPFERRD